MSENERNTLRVIRHCPVCSYKNWLVGDYDHTATERAFSLQCVCFGCGCHYDVSVSLRMVLGPNCLGGERENVNPSDSC